MLLGLTTATPRCTVALVELDGTLVAERAYDDEKNHAERIFLALDELLEASGRARSAITSVACDIGPGSFTGVRVGLASAKGIAFGLNVPLSGVGSLEAMCAAALAVAPTEIEVACAFIDAKRGETFVAAYDRDGIERVSPRHGHRGQAADGLATELGRAPVIHCGRAAAGEGVAPILEHATSELPSALWIARIAAQRPATTADLDALEPIYVRAPDAKRMPVT